MTAICEICFSNEATTVHKDGAFETPCCAECLAAQTAVRKPAHATFEVDGEQVRYEPKADKTANPLGPINLEIARKKRDAGL